MDAEKLTQTFSQGRSLGLRTDSLGRLTEQALGQYFDRLGGHHTHDLYEVVMRQVEPALLRTVMAQVRGNQSRAAHMLGINRGTLRKKLRTYGMLN